MAPTERTGKRRAAVYVRESLPEPAARQRDSLRTRLRELEAEGAVDAFDVFDCPKRIRRESPTDTDARDRFVEFAQWARDSGVSLRPSFGTRECYAMDTGEKSEWIVFPAVSLAVYEDGDLAAVYPHADGGDYRSVADGLTALTDSGTSESVGEAPTTPVTTAD